MKSKSDVANKPKPETLPVINIEDDPVTPIISTQQDARETPPVSNNDEIIVVENEPRELTPQLLSTADRANESRKSRMRLRNVSPKNIGRLQLEYAHWLHMSRHQVAKRRNRIRKRSEVGVSRQRPIGIGLVRRRPMKVGPVRRQPIAMRPTKFLRLDSSDRPAIKSAGSGVCRAPVSSTLRLPRNVVDVDTVDAAVSASGGRGVSDGVHAAIQMHFGAMARIKAGAKCRIMARRWTTDDQLEYLVQWDAGIVT